MKRVRLIAGPGTLTRALNKPRHHVTAIPSLRPTLFSLIVKGLLWFRRLQAREFESFRRGCVRQWEDTTAGG